MTTALKFRNIDASPDDPVETWPFEGILAAVERGSLPDWRRLAAAIRADPWGPVAQQVLEAIRLSHPYGTAKLLEGVVTRARELAIDSEREEVASEVRDLVVRSGLSTQDFAERIGTSRRGRVGELVLWFIVRVEVGRPGCRRPTAPSPREPSPAR